MDNQPENTALDQQVSRAIKNLEGVVSSACIEELRTAIEEDLGLNKEVDLTELRHSFEHLKERARLGHRESIETLIEFGNDTASFLSDIAKPPQRKESSGPPESAILSDLKEGGWREMIGDCVLTLLRLLETKENQGKGRFDDLLEELPVDPHVFPIPKLNGTVQFLEPLGEVTYLCDGLIQRRLDRECAKVVHDLSTNSLCWPLFITAVDYQSKKPLAECARNLELGKAIASNLGVTPRGGKSNPSRGDGTPSALVQPLLIGLEKLRRVRRTDQELEDMRRSEERNEPAPLEKLIDESRERLNRVDKVKLKWEKLRRERWLSDRAFLTKLVDDALEKLRRIDQLDLRWERLKRSGELRESDLLDLLIKADCIDLPVRYGFWSLKNIWLRKAALLPPLQPNTEVINRWAEAAYAYLASVHSGDFQEVKWPPSVDKAIVSAGSVDAGLKQFLTKGFGTLSGKNRKS